MTRKSETASEYPASLEIAILSAIKHQMISNGVIRVEELHFVVPLPDEGDYTTEMEGKLLSEGRTEEMEYVRKMGVCEVVDEKDCCDNEGLHLPSLSLLPPSLRPPSPPLTLPLPFLLPP